MQNNCYAATSIIAQSKLSHAEVVYSFSLFFIFHILFRFSFFSYVPFPCFFAQIWSLPMSLPNKLTWNSPIIDYNICIYVYIYIFAECVKHTRTDTHRKTDVVHHLLARRPLLHWQSQPSPWQNEMEEWAVNRLIPNCRASLFSGKHLRKKMEASLEVCQASDRIRYTLRSSWPAASTSHKARGKPVIHLQLHRRANLHDFCNSVSLCMCLPRRSHHSFCEGAPMTV